MTTQVQRPGVALRATAAFGLLNMALILTAAVVYYLAGAGSAEWWARGLIAICFAISEFAIVTTTIGPPLYEWVAGKEWVRDGEKPSWERNK